MQENLPARMGLAEVQTLGALLAKSGYFQDAKDAAQACVKVLAGQELGLPPIASMMGISLIKGKVTLSANLMAALIRQHGYDFRVERLEQDGCTLSFLAKDGKELGKSTFTAKDAQAAGIRGDMYNKYPRNMYFARAISNGAKWFTPEIFGGVPVYSDGELGDSEGEVVQPEPAPAPVPARQTATSVRIEGAGAPVEPAGEPPVTTRPIHVPPPADIEPRLAELYAQATGFAETVQIVTGFKPIINELTGSEHEYYRIIGLHGMAHGNELQGRTRRQIREVIKALYDYCTSVASPPPPDPAEAAEAWDALAEGTDAR
jgi:hypothetical protein